MHEIHLSTVISDIGAILGARRIYLGGEYSHGMRAANLPAYGRIYLRFELAVPKLTQYSTAYS